MHRLAAAIAFAFFAALASPAWADTKITVFGGGFAFSTGSSFHHFRHHHHGSIWRRSHEFGSSSLFHRRNHHLRLGSPHPQLFIAPRKHRHRDGKGSFLFHEKKHGGGPRVIVIIPAPLNGSIVTLHRHSSVIVVNPSGHSGVPLPSRKPFAIAISPPGQ
jgi:hypothetical protein